MVRPSSPSTPPAWKRIAALLSFVAVMSALVAPAATLAEEVRTGKLGGVCLVNTTDANGEGVPASTHCDFCGSLALVLPPLLAQTIPSQPGRQVAGVAWHFGLDTLVEGLPPSRGPPAL